MGIHISLGILVWGYTKHGDTHITVTPAVHRDLVPSGKYVSIYIVGNGIFRVFFCTKLYENCLILRNYEIT